MSQRGFSKATYQGQGIVQAPSASPASGQMIAQGLQAFGQGISRGMDISRQNAQKAKSLRQMIKLYGVASQDDVETMSLGELEGLALAAPQVLRQRQDKRFSDAAGNFIGQDLSGLNSQATASMLGAFGDQQKLAEMRADRERKANMPPAWSAPEMFPDGTLRQTNSQTGEQKILQKKDKPTEQQANAQMFGKRMARSGSIVDAVEVGEYDPAGAHKWVEDMALFPNVAKREESQIYDAAREDFVSAVLRKESGASIPDHEREAAERQYFPIAGDSDSVVSQKRALRKMVTETMLELGGDAEGFQIPSMRQVDGKDGLQGVVPKSQADIEWAKKHRLPVYNESAKKWMTP